MDSFAFDLAVDHKDLSQFANGVRPAPVKLLRDAVAYSFISRHIQQEDAGNYLIEIDQAEAVAHATHIFFKRVRTRLARFEKLRRPPIWRKFWLLHAFKSLRGEDRDNLGSWLHRREITRDHQLGDARDRITAELTAGKHKTRGARENAVWMLWMIDRSLAKHANQGQPR